MLAHKLGKDQKVTVIAKDHLLETNSRYAQGGIASVLSPDDSFDKHVHDTVVAGAGLCHQDIVRLVVEDGPRAIAELIELGVDFTRIDTDDQSDGKKQPTYHLTKEGGHSKRRVIHANDLTGQAVMEALVSAVRANPNIEIFEDAFAIDLITSDKYSPDFSANSCLGAYVLDRNSGSILTFMSHSTYLCTGGHGKVYLYTSNPDGATGDGLAMGWRAGCRVANLEFMQFHPTCLYHPEARTFLISEALRGEGAELLNSDFKPFMKSYHELGSLAPRDIVARAMDQEIKKTGASHLFLDARSLGLSRIERHFPNIYQTCLRYGIDISKDVIPVVPAAHYSCGGIVVDSSGRTSVKGLYALGEVACTGLHGANRLASNSLLEALVFADRVAQCARQEPTAHVQKGQNIPEWDIGDAMVPDEQVVLTQTWDEIRRLMWNYVGIVRTDKRLDRALERVSSIRNELHAYYWNYQINSQFLEVRNIADVAWLTIRCALQRKESRGIHYNLDHSQTNRPPLDTIIQ